MKTPQLQMQDKAPDSKVEIERLLRIAAARSTLDSDGGFLAEAQFRLAMILGLAATSLPHTDAAAELKQRVSVPAFSDRLRSRVTPVRCARCRTWLWSRRAPMRFARAAARHESSKPAQNAESPGSVAANANCACGPTTRLGTSSGSLPRPGRWAAYEARDCSPPPLKAQGPEKGPGSRRAPHRRAVCPSPPKTRLIAPCPRRTRARRPHLRASKATRRAREAPPASTRATYNPAAPLPGAARLGSDSPRRRRPGSHKFKKYNIFCMNVFLYLR